MLTSDILTFVVAVDDKRECNSPPQSQHMSAREICLVMESQNQLRLCEESAKAGFRGSREENACSDRSGV